MAHGCGRESKAPRVLGFRVQRVRVYGGFQCLFCLGFRSFERGSVFVFRVLMVLESCC